MEGSEDIYIRTIIKLPYLNQDNFFLDPNYARELALIRRPGGQSEGPSLNVEEANAVWERPAVLALLAELRARRDGKKKLKDTLAEVASALAALGHHYSVQQVRSKVDALKRRYKAIKDHKSKSGNGAPPHWEFFESMDDIFKGQAWVAPRSTASSNDGPSTSRDSTESGSSGERALMKKRKRPEEVMDDLYKKFKSDREEMMEEMRERERARQKRHEEKMELRRQFLALMAESLRGGDNGNKK
ncbi:uncharacterized protein LOC124159663 [Ischnura elegans]|uniref:uncharacterized protein LOC124159663 n=1 Tax=Ischnura elegans TaxID=197161 RepID=UPI001ED877CA|nr:uncharacterized protein LOC124159663 [Ischnura elegans]